MTYFGYLGVFLGIPIALLALITWRDSQQGRRLPLQLSSWNAWAAIAVHIVLAVVYTTPWDNYLVATGVWYYDPDLVTGLVLGWVPIEEYTFFIVQTLLTGLWMLYLAKRLNFSARASKLQPGWRWVPLLLLFILWTASVMILAVGWKPGKYLGLELAWALPPIMLQVAFGGDILYRYRRMVLSTIVPLVAYLSFTDALAISSGTWTISPGLSLEIFIGNLPVEEMIFFLLTTTLVTFGIMLLTSMEGHQRIQEILTSRTRARRSTPVE